MENRGGITVMENGQVLGEVTLSIAGIMSDDSLVMVNSALEDAKDEASVWASPVASTLHDPELHGPSGDPFSADHHPWCVRCLQSALYLTSSSSP